MPQLAKMSSISKGWVVGELVDAIQSCLDNGLTPEEILGLLDEAILETVEENS